MIKFLGGIYFAISLIAITTVMVIAGTWIESYTGSHQFANQSIYGTTFFSALLGGFFLNILLSALRRWPFKPLHIPFLITHLGLLMVITGTWVKLSLGVQGSLFVTEGSASSQVLLPGTHAIRFFSKQSEFEVDIDQTQNLFEVIKRVPHCTPIMDAFFQGDYAYIFGVPPIRCSEEPLEVSNLLFKRIYAFRSNHPIDLAQKFYLEETVVNFQANSSLTIPLSKLIEQPTIFDETIISCSYDNENTTLQFCFKPLSSKYPPAELQIPLSSPDALVPKNAELPGWGQYPIQIHLEREPTLILIQTKPGEEHLFFFDAEGRMHRDYFTKETLKTYVAYDRGYGGYAKTFTIPLHTLTKTDVAQKFRSETLPPPLQILDAEATVSFLESWGDSYSWFYPEEKPLDKHLIPYFLKLEWDKIPPQMFRGCQWCSHLFKSIEYQVATGVPLQEILLQEPWVRVESKNFLEITQAFLDLPETLPSFDSNQSSNPALQARWLSVLFRAYGLSPDWLKRQVSLSNDSFQIETPLTPGFIVEESLRQLEKNLPGVEIKIADEVIQLTYDNTRSGWKWPISGGMHLIQYGPKTREIPFRIRLREARQINYANSTKPFSYEADLIISSRGKEVETTLSMNHVYETWDGYRFYLSNISPKNTNEVKRAQIVVNRDPAKYFITYPGGILVTLGVFLLLFWRRLDRFSS